MRATLFLVFCFMGGIGVVSAQDCLLGIGGKNDKEIAALFQLNADQKASMEQWSQELRVYQDSMEVQAQQLLERHPQGSPEELTDLAQKYKVLQGQILQKAVEYDSKLLALFNERQYQRYVDLCAEAIRNPLPRYQE